MSLQCVLKQIRICTQTHFNSGKHFSAKSFSFMNLSIQTLLHRLAGLHDRELVVQENDETCFKGARNRCDFELDITRILSYY